MNEFVTGQQLLTFPDVKRYVLVNVFSNEQHLVTEAMLREAFKDEYTKIMANRNSGWTVTDYYD